MKIMQGDAYVIPFEIKNENDAVIKPADLIDLEIVVGINIKTYKNNELSYANGQWLYPLTQEESLKMIGFSGNCQVRVKLIGGAVIGVKVGTIDVENSLSKVVL